MNFKINNDPRVFQAILSTVNVLPYQLENDIDECIDHLLVTHFGPAEKYAFEYGNDHGIPTTLLDYLDHLSIVDLVKEMKTRAQRILLYIKTEEVGIVTQELDTNLIDSIYSIPYIEDGEDKEYWIISAAIDPDYKRESIFKEINL